MDVAHLTQIVQIIGLIAAGLPGLLTVLVILSAIIPGPEPQRTLRRMLDASHDLGSSMIDVVEKYSVPKSGASDESSNTEAPKKDGPA